MKRTSQKSSDRKLKSYSNKKSTSFLYKTQIFPLLIPLIELEDAKSSCTSVTGFIVESINRSVENLIDKIEQKNRQRNILSLVLSLENFIQNGVQPFVESKDEFNIPEEELAQISCDNLCKGDTSIYQKSSIDKRPSGYCTPKQYTCAHSFKEFQRSIIESKVHNLIPLAGAQSMKDIKTLQIQNAYRQKFVGRPSIENQQIIKEAKFYEQRFKTNEKKQFQYNFDYDGERIVVNPLTIAKKFQINILRPLYRINKDRHDVKKEKKQVITYSKLPKVASRTTFHCVAEDSILKSSIQKCVNQRGCKISSIKLISSDKK